MEITPVIAILLGLVEGVTEFLPISSTGHLVLAGHALGLTGEKAALFEVFIQFGAIFAVTLVSFDRFRGLLPDGGEGGMRSWRGCLRLALTTLPALVAGLLLHGTIKAKLFSPPTVMVGLAVGGAAILAVERWVRGRPRGSGLDEISVGQAFCVGLFQCCALWPGMSRSGSTILGGMLVGIGREAAVRYSFLAAVPVMVAAVGYDLWRGRALLSLADAPAFAIGFAVSFLSALMAIRWMLRLLERRDLVPFGIYRLAIALAGALWLAWSGRA